MQVLNALRTLWITLPLRGVTDEQGTLDAYGFALEPFSIEAIQNTINSLRRGEIEDASKQWCPRPPELASFVRAEQKRLEAIHSRPAVSYAPVDVPFKDWRVIHRQRANDLQAAGFGLFRKEVTIDIFSLGCRRRAWPAGSIWFWCIEEVWAPPAAAMPTTDEALNIEEKAA
jgi:hypothetical protein